MRTRACAALCALMLPACSGSELVGLHLAVQRDGTAVVTVRALVEAAPPSPAEVVAKGATFARRAALVYSQGTVADLAALQFGDDSLQIVPRLDAGKITVRLQRRPTAAWVGALVPDRSKRRELAAVYDPLGRTKEVGDVLRLEIACPAAVNGSSVLPTARGVEAGREGNRAYLVIPADTAREQGEALSWDITWN